MKSKHWVLIGIGGLVTLAATWWLVRESEESYSEKPPKKALQLDIENPGSQADFPHSPGESQIG